MSVLLEIEHKYDMGPTMSVRDLHLDDEGLTLSEMSTKRLHALYFDTETGSLLRARVTLRRRTGGSDAGWHLKVPGRRTSERFEVQRPLGGATAQVPTDYVRALTGITRGAALVQVLDMRTVRRAREVRDSSGETIARIVEDEVTAHPTAAGEDSKWRELELELVRPDSELEERLCSLLERAGARRAQVASKAERALGAPTRASRLRTRDAVGTRLSRQAEVLAVCHARVVLGIGDAVHEMRIAARRLYACAVTFDPVLRRRANRDLTRELRWFAGELGGARDAQVLGERVRRELETRADGDEYLLRERVDEACEKQIAAATQSLEEALASERYSALLAALAIAAADVPYRRQRRPSRKRLMRCALAEANAIRDALEEGLRSIGEERDVRLHEVRKIAKRARYAAETLVLVDRKRLRRVIRELTAVQDTLGERHDAVLAIRFLGALACEDEHEVVVRDSLVAAISASLDDIDAEGEDMWRTACAHARAAFRGDGGLA